MSATRRWISKCCCKGSSDRVLEEDEDQSVATKDEEIEVLQEEDQSVATKDQVIECYRIWISKMKTQCCRRWCSSTKYIEDITVNVPVDDDRWKLPMTYRCITLILLKILSLLYPIVDDFVVSRIPFSLRVSVEIL